MESAMKLYYSPGACSLADHIALEWIGKPDEAVRVSADDRRTPAYRAMNPAGAVPVLDDDGWVRTQNAAIHNYLADLNPGAGLLGDGSPRGRAEVTKWLAVVNSDIHPAFKPLFGAIAWIGDDALVAKGKEVARDSLRELFARVDAQLAGRDWIAGTRSIADPYLFVVLRWARALAVDLSGMGHLERFFDAMQADPGVRRALAQEGLD
jgi:glutathione S-transferase